MPFIHWCTSGDPLHFIVHNGLILAFVALGALPFLPALRAYAKEKLHGLKHQHTDDCCEQHEGHDEEGNNHKTQIE